MNVIFILPLSLIGFIVSFYIYYSKKCNKEIICPIGNSCNFVVKSKYGRTFGIENTIPGMIYFALIFLYGIIELLNRNIFKASIIYYFIVIISILSVLFSIYLTSVQAFVLKKWCEYCILSSIISVLILMLLII